ncbi:hypothetical protein [Paenibacillus oryzisoli]|uniref:Uncharacterized protein n=1 Tax=Paenibacillus oryzisoli TaxID=1850517 RepID=A0A198ADV4_9BACL|nr:hypothetical protein [Paenibacillus oryzisoli]OAS19236.1 hypothetical protein A8708_26355 [Paenibacillus oryzisoli]
MLKDLKDRFDEVQEYYIVSEKELEWLIQQAEKAERYKIALESVYNAPARETMRNYAEKALKE